jgi:hypothetical protein
MARKDILGRENDIKQWILEGKSKAWICRQLRCKPSTLDRWLARMNIQYSGNKGRKGFKRVDKRRPLMDYLVKDSPFIQSYRLKKRLIDEGYKEHRCEECNNTEWLGVPIPLEIHHVDGDRHNNELNNLQILCPNCHSLTPNNSGRSLRKKHRYCVDCGSEITKGATCCKSCQAKKQPTKIDWPDTEALIQMVKDTSFEAVGRKLGVSGNAVRKRLKNHS